MRAGEGGVIPGAFGWVGQDFVGVLDGGESGVVGGDVADFVGMGLKTALSPCLADLLCGGISRDSEGVVVGCHLGLGFCLLESVTGK